MIDFSKSFLKELKQLSKKYKLIKDDIQLLIKDLEQNQNLGKPLGNNLYKIRVANSYVPTGKSGGFRVITYIVLENKIVLIKIYSKTEKEDLTDIELSNIIKSIDY